MRCKTEHEQDLDDAGNIYFRNVQRDPQQALAQGIKELGVPNPL